jgi:hypothetical protein
MAADISPGGASRHTHTAEQEAAFDQADADFNASGASKHDHSRQTQTETKVAVDWSIKNLDDDELIQPQLPMPEDGIQVNYGGTLVDQQRFGEQDPITHWVHGVTKNVTFNAVLFTRNTDEAADVEDLFDQITALTEKDDTLGRPPICIFRYGNFFSVTCLVEKADSNIVSVDKDGFVREVRLSISLRKYVPFSQQQIDPTKPAKESFYLIATSAERSYEAIARRWYGDPLKGDRIRKRHPGQAFAPRIGDKVKVPPKAIILKETIEPAFHALSLTDEEAVANFELILADRSARRIFEVV